jgi:hypothetical protein
MNERRIVVPEGMLKAVQAIAEDHGGVSPYSDRGKECYPAILEAALRHLSEHRQDMSPTLLRSIRNDVSFIGVNETDIYEIVNAALRRMFLAPEPETPEQIKDLLWEDVGCRGVQLSPAFLNDQIREAFRRGQKSGPR